MYAYIILRNMFLFITVKPILPWLGTYNMEDLQEHVLIKRQVTI